MRGELINPENTAIIAAIAGGFSLVGLLIILLSVIALLHRFTGKKLADNRQAKPSTARDGALYSGLLPQSTMGLMSSTSGQSFVSSPSELFTLDKCVSGSVVEFHRNEHHETRPASPSATIRDIERKSGYENPAMNSDEARDSNSDEGEDGYGPIQITKAEKQESSA